VDIAQRNKSTEEPGEAWDERRTGAESRREGRQRLGFCRNRWRRRRRRPYSCRAKEWWRLGPACRIRSQIVIGLGERGRKVADSGRKNACLSTLCWGTRNPWLRRAVSVFFAFVQSLLV